MSDFLLLLQAFAWGSAGLAIGALFNPSRAPADREACDLLERCRYDLEQGWDGAAYDALCRAQRLLQTHEEQRHD